MMYDELLFQFIESGLVCALVFEISSLISSYPTYDNEPFFLSFLFELALFEVLDTPAGGRDGLSTLSLFPLMLCAAEIANSGKSPLVKIQHAMSPSLDLNRSMNNKIETKARLIKYDILQCFAICWCGAMEKDMTLDEQVIKFDQSCSNRNLRLLLPLALRGCSTYWCVVLNYLIGLNCMYDLFISLLDACCAVVPGS